jgi:uncharacterized protein
MTIFINKNSQLYAGWKIAITLMSIIFAIFICTVLAAFLLVFIIICTDHGQFDLANIVTQSLSSPFFSRLSNILQCVTFIFFSILYWKVFDKKPITKLGLTSFKKGYKNFIIGFIFGALSISTVFALLLFTGHAKLSGSFSSPKFSFDLLTYFIIFIFVGFSEEIFGRGYCLNVINNSTKKLPGVLISSIIFSLMHAANPNISLIAFINIFLVGILFSYMVLKTNNLWMPIGFHISWNYFQGNIWGFPVSGTNWGSLYKTIISNNNIYNGGKFGPEGGIIVSLIILLSFIVVWKTYSKKSSKQIYQ